MPTLRELEAEFWKHDGAGHSHVVPTLAEADGVMFLCPKCFVSGGGKIGCHSVLCWFEDKVPDDLDPKPGRWKPTGTGLDDLTFVHGKRSNSVELNGGCNWHGFVTNGRAE